MSEVTPSTSAVASARATTSGDSSAQVQQDDGQRPELGADSTPAAGADISTPGDPLLSCLMCYCVLKTPTDDGDTKKGKPDSGDIIQCRQCVLHQLGYCNALSSQALVFLHQLVISYNLLDSEAPAKAESAKRKTRGKKTVEVEENENEAEDKSYDLISEEEASKYRAFLTEIYHVNFPATQNATIKERIQQSVGSESAKNLESLIEFPICNKCVGELKSLYEVHQKYIEQKNLFEKKRDDVAASLANVLDRKSVV